MDCSPHEVEIKDDKWPSTPKHAWRGNNRPVKRIQNTCNKSPVCGDFDDWIIHPLDSRFEGKIDSQPPQNNFN